MDYDPHAKVIRLRASLRDRRQLAYAFLLLTGFYAGTRWTGTKLHGAYTDILILVAVMLPTFYRLWRSVGESYFLILNRHGVQFDDPRFDCDPIPWRSVSKAKYGWLSNKFYLLGRDGAKIVTHPADRMASPRTVRRCVREINRLLTVYSSSREESD